MEKEHNGTSWVTQSNWKYLWDGLELVQKRDASSGTIRASYFGRGEQQGSDELVYQSDHLGNVRHWYSVSDGGQGEAEFSVWGVRSVTTTGPGVPERGYTGHLHHAVSGLVLAPFRGYDANWGRWISEDPIEERGGDNLYRYVADRPLMAIDPLGTDLLVVGAPTMAGAAQHAFVYSTKEKRGYGMHGSSGTALPGQDGVSTKLDGTPNLDNSRKVDLKGMTEKEALQRIKSWPGWHDGVWFPFLNDCHGQLESAFGHAGIPFPGVPDGRIPPKPNAPKMPGVSLPRALQPGR